MDSIPEGDWFCPECISKATRRPCCLLCSRQTSRSMVACQECQRNFHCDCVVVRLPGSRSSTDGRAPEPDAQDWTCDGCLSTKNNSNSPREHKNPNRKRKLAKINESVSISHCNTVTKVKRIKNALEDKSLKTVSLNSEDCGKVTPRGTKRRNSNDSSLNVVQALKPPSPLKSTEVCGILLAELDAHKDSWPFRTPVKTEVFPLYKEVIKKPIDLCLIRQNLNSNRYENIEEFLADVRLMFDNCKTFNEDDSPVGKAGHNLRRFLKKRWKELREATGMRNLR